MNARARYQREESKAMTKPARQRWTPGWKPGLFPSMAPEHNPCCCPSCIAAQPRRRLTFIAQRARVLKRVEEVVGGR